jgi:hypothetical protein
MVEANSPRDPIIMWRFRGTPHYLTAQAQRLGITQVLADRARHNPEIYRCAALLAQLCERYHAARKEDGVPIFGRLELDQIKGTLGQCEQELQKLHMLAATSSAMLAEAYAAFDLEPPSRPFEVMSDDLETPPHTLRLGNGTVGALDDTADVVAC